MSKKFDLPEFNCSFRAACILEYTQRLAQNNESLVIPLVVDYPRRWRLTRDKNLSLALTELLNHPVTSQFEENAHHFSKFSADNHDWWLRHPAFLAELQREKSTELNGEADEENHI